MSSEYRETGVKVKHTAGRSDARSGVSAAAERLALSLFSR